MENNFNYTTGFSNNVACRRYTARLFDMLFYPLVLGVILGIIKEFIGNEILDKFVDFILTEPNVSQGKIAFEYMWSLATCLIFIPLSFQIFGTTLGKKIMGIKIRNKDNTKLNYMESVEREGMVFLFGLSLKWVTIIYQYFNFRKQGVSDWDTDLNTYYIQYPTLNLFIRYCIILSFIIGVFVLTYIGE